MDFIIRQAIEREDSDLIAQFQIKLAKETEDLDLDADRTKKGVSYIFNHPEEGEYWVSEHKGEIIGCLLTLYEWSDWRQGKVLWVHSVYIKENFRGRGAFKKLYHNLKEKVEKDPSLLGIRLYVDKKNEKAQKAYKALGMTDEHYKLFEWMP